MMGRCVGKRSRMQDRKREKKVWIHSSGEEREIKSVDIFLLKFML